MSELEEMQERLADDQENLKSGRLKQEDYDRSLAEKKIRIAEIAAKQPESAPVQTSAARAYVQAGEYQAAVEHASQAMELAPRDPFPVTTRGLAYYHGGQFARAAADAKRALALDPHDPVAKAIYELSKDRVPGDGGAIKRAMARAGRELLALPRSPYALEPAASGSSAGGLRSGDDPELARYRSEEGRRYARKVIAAETAMRRKDYLTAFGHANDALATYADNPRVMAARAVSAWNLGEHRVTIADATRVLRSLTDGHPVQHPMLVARAGALSETGRHAEALRDAERATALFPRSGRAYLERAIAKEGLREAPSNVLADYQRAAELDAAFTTEYERALARLAPGGMGRESAKALGRSPGGGDGLLATVIRDGEAALSSRWGLAAICAVFVGLLAALIRGRR